MFDFDRFKNPLGGFPGACVRKKLNIKSFYKEWIESLLIAGIIALCIRHFVIQPFRIPSSSMAPTLVIGDYLFANKFIYGPLIPFTDRRLFSWKEPARGDIVVFKYPNDEKKYFIKRVIGIPGDKIQIIDGRLAINDSTVPTNLVSGDNGGDPAVFQDKNLLFDEQLGSLHHFIHHRNDQHADNFGPIFVPVDSVFVMGDNRDNSMDSRFWGFVKFNKIIGPAICIYWSWDSDRLVRLERIGKVM